MKALLVSCPENCPTVPAAATGTAAGFQSRGSSQQLSAL
jgi:hypothetical protein